MMKKKHAKKDKSRVSENGSTPLGVILERFKRLNGLPARELDWQSQYFRTHFLGAKKKLLY